MNLAQFADDKSILCRGNSIKDLRTSMLETLEKVHDYLNANKPKLVLNVDKTELIVYGEKNNFEKIFYSEETIPAN